MKALSNSRCQGASGLKAWPGCVSRTAWIWSNSAATSRTARSACSFALLPARAAERVQRRMRLARADVFADQMRFGDRHVKFRRLVAGIGRRIFDDQTFLARFFVHPPIHIGGYVAG